MKSIRLSSILTTAICGLLSFNLQAQAVKRSSHELGLMLGGMYYIGDINPLNHFTPTMRPGGGIIYRYNFNDRLTLRAHFLLGNLAADDKNSSSAYQKQRGLNFTNSIKELAVVGEFNFLPYTVGDEKTPYTPYLFLGVNGFLHQPTARFDNSEFELQDVGTEGQNVKALDRDSYSTTQIAIPFGLGVKFSMARNIGLGLEWGFRKTFTDYLDDVSTTYPGPRYLSGGALFLSDPTGVSYLDNTGTLQRGISKTKDWYNFIGLTLTFKLRQREKCAQFH